MPFELFVALRYLLARRKQAFISLISLISALGVAVGVMALIIALALMTGLQGELRDRILGSTAHVYVCKPGERASPTTRPRSRELRALPRRRSARRRRSSARRWSRPARGEAFITIKGIDPALEPTVTDIERRDADAAASTR